MQIKEVSWINRTNQLALVDFCKELTSKLLQSKGNRQKLVPKVCKGSLKTSQDVSGNGFVEPFYASIYSKKRGF